MLKQHLVLSLHMGILVYGKKYVLQCGALLFGVVQCCAVWCSVLRAHLVLALHISIRIHGDLIGV